MTKNLLNLKEKALVSQKPPRVQIILSDSFYESVQKRHADENALRASQGLPPVSDESPFISQSQAKAQAEAEARQRASQAAQKAAANLAPPSHSRPSLPRSQGQSRRTHRRHPRLRSPQPQMPNLPQPLRRLHRTALSAMGGSRPHLPLFPARRRRYHLPTRPLRWPRRSSPPELPLGRRAVHRAMAHRQGHFLHR